MMSRLRPVRTRGGMAGGPAAGSGRAFA